MNEVEETPLDVDPIEPGWAVVLLGHDFDLLDWLETLNRPFDPVVEKLDDGSAVLRSSEFAELQTAAEVRERAIALIGRLNGAMSVWRGSRPLTMGGVVRIDADGRHHRTVFGEVGVVEMRTRASGHGTLLGPDGMPVPRSPPQPSAPQDWIDAAANDDDVGDLLAFAGRADNWYDVYKAIELARLVAGRKRLERLLGTSASECERMRVTANYYRHARTHRPAVLMSLSDAKPLLHFMVRTALATRTSPSET